MLLVCKLPWCVSVSHLMIVSGSAVVRSKLVTNDTDAAETVWSEVQEFYTQQGITRQAVLLLAVKQIWQHKPHQSS